MLDKERVLVYTTNQPYKADIIKLILSDNEIDCFIINKMDSNYLFGGVELYVDPNHVLRAKVLIEKFEQS